MSDFLPMSEFRHNLRWKVILGQRDGTVEGVIVHVRSNTPHSYKLLGSSMVEMISSRYQAPKPSRSARWALKKLLIGSKAT